MAYKAFYNTLKNPIMKTFSNTLKNSIGIIRRKKNNIKNLVFGLEKAGERNLGSKHNFGRKFVENIRKERIQKFSYKAPYLAREGKKNI